MVDYFIICHILYIYHIIYRYIQLDAIINNNYILPFRVYYLSQSGIQVARIRTLLILYKYLIIVYHNYVITILLLYYTIQYICIINIEHVSNIYIYMSNTYLQKVHDDINNVINIYNTLQLY